MLKCATTTTPKTKLAKMRAKPKTIGTANVNVSTALLRRCCLSDKLSVLFKPLHVSRFHSHFLF